MIYFSLFSMRLSPSHDSGYGLDKLTLIDPSCFFVCFFNCVFFFKFIFQHWVYWKLDFIIFSIYFLLGYPCLWPDHAFDRLTSVNADHFFGSFFNIFQFYPSTLNLFKIKIERLTRFNSIYCCLNIY